jgi:hypothetical protein
VEQSGQVRRRQGELRHRSIFHSSRSANPALSEAANVQGE